MELGHYFNLCLPIGILLWLIEGRRRITSPWLLMSVCILIGLVLTFTFGAWLALLATGGLFFLFFGGSYRGKVAVAGTLILSLLVILVVHGPLYPLVQAKLTGTDMGSFAWDAATRLYNWKLALQIWWSHPWVGAGMGNFEYFYAGNDLVLGANSQGSSPHQTYLYLLANFGLVGTVSVLLIIVGALRSNIKVMLSRSETAGIGLALAFALATNMIGGFADDSGFFGPHASSLLWIFIGLSEVLLTLSPLRLKERP